MISLIITNGSSINDDQNIDDILDGDIRIPVEMMLEYYNFSSFSGGQQMIQKLKKIVSNKNVPKSSFQTEAAARYESNLWSNRIVPYRISSSFSEKTRANIHKGIQQWEENTCLQFVPAEPHHVNFVEFVEADFCSASIGMLGGAQAINIGSWCSQVGNVAHEIGHTIGFWHEHSRPDRDEYLTVNTTNIEDGLQINFAKVLENKVDYQGSIYDFGSIMHYPLHLFSIYRWCYNPTCQTLRIKNFVEYQHQGKPYIGQRVSPSKRDIEQANRLYSCPGRGIKGMFHVKLMLGKFQHDYSTTSNICVKIILVYSNGTESTHLSSHKKTANAVIWNEMILSSKSDLQFFRISTWSTNSGNVQQITMSETVLVQPGTHYNLKNCDNAKCDNFVLFEYSIIPDGKQSSAMPNLLFFVWHFIPCWLLTFNHYFDYKQVIHANHNLKQINI